MNLLALPNLHRADHEPPFDTGIYTFLNPYSYLLARMELKLFSSFDRIFFDGVAIMKLFAIFGLAKSRRMSFDMTSLAPVVLSDCARKGKTVYFVGSADDEIVRAIEVFRQAFPGLAVAGYRHGYFDGVGDIERTQREIRDLDPDVVVAGLGTPLQERFLVGLRDLGWKGTGFTCGGFFHQTAKRGAQYYPRWVNRLHLRWLFRIYDEPKLVKRYLVQYPYFLFVFGYDLFLYYLHRRLNK